MSYDEKIELLIEEMLEGEYSPTNADNISEAIQMLDDGDISEIEGYLKDGDQLAIGKLIANHIECYWMKQAEKDAPSKLEAAIDNAKRERAADRHADRIAA